MSRLTQKGQGAPVEIGATSTDVSLETLVGTRYDGSDGREYVLVQNAGTAIKAGAVVQGPAAQANAVGLSPATTSTTGYSASYPIVLAIGAKTFQIATGATAVLANRFAGGYMVVVEGTGLGQIFKVASNSAASTTSACVITVEDAAKVATSTDSRFSFTINPYGSLNGTDYTTDGVIISPATTLTGLPIGVTAYPLAASTATVPVYGLIQTKGPASVLGSSTVALGIDVCVPSGTAGAHTTYVVATGPRIGTTMVASASGKNNLVNLDM
jgi:hypothetical protein